MDKEKENIGPEPASRSDERQFQVAAISGDAADDPEVVRKRPADEPINEGKKSIHPVRKKRVDRTENDGSDHLL